MSKSGERLIAGAQEAVTMAKLLNTNSELEEKNILLLQEIAHAKEDKDRAWSQYFEIKKDRDEFKVMYNKAQSNFEEERSMSLELRKDVNRCLGWIAAKRDEHPLGDKAHSPLDYRTDYKSDGWHP